MKVVNIWARSNRTLCEGKIKKKSNVIMVMGVQGPGNRIELFTHAKISAHLKTVTEKKVGLKEN